MENIGEAMREGLRLVANAITPVGSLAGEDATGGRVASLTEAVMGMTKAMVQIADAIDHLAEAVSER